MSMVETRKLCSRCGWVDVSSNAKTRLREVMISRENHLVFLFGISADLLWNVVGDINWPMLTPFVLRQKFRFDRGFVCVKIPSSADPLASQISRTGLRERETLPEVARPLGFIPR
jgi:hypothetical protein